MLCGWKRIGGLGMWTTLTWRYKEKNGSYGLLIATEAKTAPYLLLLKSEN